jgi:hypothetical protein
MSARAPARRPAPRRCPAGIVVPPRIPGDTARVVLIGAPGPLRSAIARRLRASTALVACLDTPRHLRHILSSAYAPHSGSGLAGTAVVFLAVPQPPGLARRLRFRYRPSSLPGDFEQAAMTARSRGGCPRRRPVERLLL